MGRVIGVEGIIGAGKTTLVRALERDYDVVAIYEPVDENPLLERFYADEKRYAFTIQMWLLARRHAANKAAFWTAQTGPDVIVDRGRQGDRCFARVNAHVGNMSGEELDIYENFYRTMDARDPDAIIFLDVGVDEALRRIAERGRDCEKDIDPKYLGSLYNEHLTMLASARHRGVRTFTADDTLDVDDIACALELTPRGA